MRPSTPRLVDIAERAGVSITTVSRILTGQRLTEFSEKTREKVQRIAEEMDWRPNLVGRGMKTGRTDTVGVFVSPFDAFWTGVLYGIHDALLEAGKVPLVLWPHAMVHPSLADGRRSERGGDALPITGPPAGSRRELERINRLADRQVDAIITWPLHEQDARDRLETLATRGRRVVLVDDALPSGAGATIALDEPAAMDLVLGHLRGLGHRPERTAFVGITRGHDWATRRAAAFAAAAPEGSRLLLKSDGDAAAEAEVAALLQQRPETTALVAATDHLARAAIRGAHAAGRSVPGDLSVTGYGNDTFGGGGVDLQLTTIDQRAYEVGTAAAGAAVAEATPPPRVEVPGDLLPGQSVAAPRG